MKKKYGFKTRAFNEVFFSNAKRTSTQEKRLGGAYPS